VIILSCQESVQDALRPVLSPIPRQSDSARICPGTVTMFTSAAHPFAIIVPRADSINTPRLFAPCNNSSSVRLPTHSFISAAALIASVFPYRPDYQSARTLIAAESWFSASSFSSSRDGATSNQCSPQTCRAGQRKTPTWFHPDSPYRNCMRKRTRHDQTVASGRFGANFAHFRGGYV